MRTGDVFIHGIFTRSGTNYLSRALRCHPDVAASPRSLWEFPHLRHSDPLVTYVESMARSPKLPELEKSALLAMLGDAWLAYASEGLPEGRRLVLKEPSVQGLHRFFQFFPGSYLLLLIRDGRDIACSAMRTEFASPRSVDWRSPRTYRRLLGSRHAYLARRWRQASREIRRFLETREQDKPVLVVRYEDLVGEAEAEMRRILAFLALSPERFDWSAYAGLDVRGSSFAKRKEGHLDWDRGSSREAFKLIGRWQSWSGRELRRYEAVAGEELRHWGYMETPISGG